MEAVKSEHKCWVLFGGSFNPPHKAHLKMAQKAIQFLEQQGKVPQLFFIPTASPPHKRGEPLVSLSVRAYMLHLLLSTDANLYSKAKVSLVEAHLPTPSYTLNTVQTFKKQNSQVCFYFLMGQDSFQSLKQWHRPEQLAKEVCFLVVPRGTQDLKKPPTVLGLKYQFLPGPVGESASSYIRALIRQQKFEELKKHLPSKLRHYIIERNLYAN